MSHSQHGSTPSFVRTIAIAAMLALSAVCLAKQQVIWSIGKPDKTGAELGLFGDYNGFAERFRDDVHFEVGKSQDSDWPYIHPGPVDDWAGKKQHAFAIDFDLPAIPTGACQIGIDTIAVQPHVPTLLVSINGTTSTILLSPTDEGAVRDESLKHPAHYSVTFAPDLLKVGRNEIAFTLTSGSWMLYDSVQLETDPDIRSLLQIRNVEPSVMWLRDRNGDRPTITVTASSGRPARALLRAVCGEKQTELRTDLQLGDTRIEMPLPVTTQTSDVVIVLSTDAEKTSKTFPVPPQRKWKIFVVPSIHTDIGYTDRQQSIFERHNDNFERALKLSRSNPQIRWNSEVSWELKNYLERRPKQASEKMLEQFRTGRFGLQAGYLNLLTGLLSDEGLCRYASYASDLRHQYGINFCSAVMTDNPTVTWGLCAALANSGIRYFAEGCNSDRGPMLPHSGIKTPFYWEAPDGSRVLTLLTDCYAQSRWMVTGSLDELGRSVQELVSQYERSDYPYDAVYLYGAFFDNQQLDMKYGQLLEKWSEKYSYPKFVIGDGTEFFKHIEKKYAAQIPTKRGDFGAYWEDGAGSTAQETSFYLDARRRMERVDTLCAMSQLVSPSPLPRDQIAKAWDDLLFYAEHTWGAAQSVSDPDCAMTRDQWDFKARYATSANALARSLEEGALTAYCGKATSSSITVANPLSWTISGQINLPSSFDNCSLLDDQGRAIPVQRAGEALVAFVREIPAFGTRTFRTIVSKVPAQSASRATQLENKFYRIGISPGSGITSIIDKETNRELVNQSAPWSFGQLVYASGGEGTRIMQHHQQPEPLMELNAGGDGLAPNKGSVLMTSSTVTAVKSLSEGPVFSEAVLVSEAPSMPKVETSIRLHNLEKRISFDIRITSKTEVRQKEAVYVAFPMAGSKPSFRLGMPGVVSDPVKDFIHGACHEWYSVEDFAACLDRSSGQEVVIAPLDAPLVTLGDINRGLWPSDAATTTPTLFSYAMNNYWHTNYKAGQGGDFRFRYEMTSSGATPLSDAQRLRFARSVANPPLAIAATGVATAPQVSLESDAIIASMKPAAYEPGVVLRLRNCQDTTQTVALHVPPSSQSVVLTDLTETVLKRLKATNGLCKLELDPLKIATVRIH